MRLTLSFLLMAAMLVPGRLAAQQPAAAPAAQTPHAQPATASVIPDIATSNFVDFGFRGTAYAEGSDEARYQRYRDLRNGFTVDAFRFAKATDARWLVVTSDHAGYRDQRYTAAVNEFGRVKATFEWNQIPLFFSQDTLALHTTESAGVLRIADSIQSGIQGGTTTLPGVVNQAIPFEMRLKRSIADLRLTYTASPTVDVDFFLRSTSKTGSQPYAGTFGFSNAVELAVPVDTTTTELGASLEWADTRGSARVGYDGSFFRNDIDTLVWDSPLRITDSSSSGPFQGRMPLWPDSSLNAISAMGALNLPARSRAIAYVSIGNWSQDAVLIPFTINTALPVYPLDRPSAEADALVTAMNLSFTSRPAPTLSFLARYRSYDFDNQMPIFGVTNTISYDASASTYAHGGASPFGLTRRTFDGEVSWTPLPFTALRAGYTVEGIEQTQRYVDSTTENRLKLSADLTGTNWLTLRGVYEYGKRVGSGFDEQVLDDIGEQVSLRQFDISDRSTDRVSAIVMVFPLPSVSFSGTVSFGNDDRSPDAFGVLNGDGRAYSIGVDYVPRPEVSFGTSYTYERYATLQRSRQANPGAEFEDPTRDWTTDATERADTFTADLDLIKAVSRTDIRFAYTYTNADSLYLYGLPPNTTLPPISQLPAVVNKMQRATFDLRYYLNRHLAPGIVYWFDKYSVNDYANEPGTLNSIAQPSFLMIGYTARPYTANTFVGRLTYLW